VSRITIEVGELMDHGTDDIKQTLEQLSGWTVVAVEKKGLVECDCGYKGAPRILEKSHGVILFACPQCGGRPNVLEGDGVRVLKVE
jgi:Zn finger protein HypA/HybF involved in hydrogenase expression